MKVKSPSSSFPLPASPPEFPWIALNSDSGAHSYLSFYYVSRLAALPVRDVNRVNSRSDGTYLADCKSDPNVETGTFGLFSTCQAQTRLGVVNNRSPYLFFFGTCRTPMGWERCITGYYRLGWYAHGGTHSKDYCLAASQVHFVKFPIPFREINQQLGTTFGSRNPPRVMCRVEAPTANRIVELLNHQKDASAAYISEIHRLERINSDSADGLKYINFGRRESFSWEDIRHFTNIGRESDQPRRRNRSATGMWVCPLCLQKSASASKLKICPACGASCNLAAVAA